MTKIIDFRKPKLRKKYYNDKSSINLNNVFKDKYKFIFLLLSISGIFIGAVSYKIFNNTALTELITNSFSQVNSGSFNDVLLYFLRLEVMFFSISFFIGTSFLGSTVSFAVPMLKTIYIGYFSSFLYNQYELKGVLFALILLYPCFIITTASLIIAANENIYMCKYIFNCLNQKGTNDNISIKLYTLRYILLLTINMVAVVITSLMITVIGPKINI